MEGDGASECDQLDAGIPFPGHTSSRGAGGTAVLECQGRSGMGAIVPSMASLLSHAELKALFTIGEACWQRCFVLLTCVSPPCRRDTVRGESRASRAPIRMGFGQQLVAFFT